MGRRLKPIAFSLPFTKVIVTCEHASNAVPRAYARFFRSAKARKALESHRGWDPGAAALARALARAFRTTPVLGGHSRLVCDLNRSPWNRRGGVTSEFMASLSDVDRTVLIDRLHTPHWRVVEEQVAAEVDAGGVVLHLGVHSFTPALNGVVRTADFALLYDPARELERKACGHWLAALSASVRDGTAPALRLRRNYPYLGTSDGLTTHLRKRFGAACYAGIEIEFNQSLLTPRGVLDSMLTAAVIRSLAEALV